MVFLATLPLLPFLLQLLILFMGKMGMCQKLSTSLLFLAEHHFLGLLSIYT